MRLVASKKSETFYSRTDENNNNTPRLTWAEKHQQFVSRSKASEHSTVFLGDSLFSNFEHSRNSDIWQSNFGEDVMNLSIGGDKIENVMWRVSKNELPPNLASAYILIGTNNLKHNTAAEIANGISDLVHQVKQIHPLANITVLGLLPRDLFPSWKRKKIDIVNYMIA